MILNRGGDRPFLVMGLVGTVEGYTRFCTSSILGASVVDLGAKRDAWGRFEGVGSNAEMGKMVESSVGTERPGMTTFQGKRCEQEER